MGDESRRREGREKEEDFRAFIQFQICRYITDAVDVNFVVDMLSRCCL